MSETKKLIEFLGGEIKKCEKEIPTIAADVHRRLWRDRQLMLTEIKGILEEHGQPVDDDLVEKIMSIGELFAYNNHDLTELAEYRELEKDKIRKLLQGQVK